MRRLLRFSGVAVSHTGLVRTGNEDSGFLGPQCMVVADGVGGAAAGEIASATAAHIVSMLALSDPLAEPLGMLRKGVVLAQEQIADGVLREPARCGMATTLTAVATDGETFGLAHLGDSRGYVFREGRLTRITTDHTYVQRLVDEGNLDEREVRNHPWRNVVIRTVDGTPAESGEVTRLRLRVGDRLLLVTDGLTDLVSEPHVEALLLEHHDDAAADALLDAALAAGGTDNVTCLLATVVEGPAVTADGVQVGALRDPGKVVDPASVQMLHTA